MLAALEEDVLPLGTQDIEVLRTSQPRRGQEGAPRRCRSLERFVKLVAGMSRSSV